jgi:hypothetical protein
MTPDVSFPITLRPTYTALSTQQPRERHQACFGVVVAQELKSVPRDNLDAANCGSVACTVLKR